MLWRRPRILWTDPLQPPTQYVNVLGSKLKMLLRAPSGIDGSTVIANSWRDEVSGRALTRTFGTPTLVQDGSNFSGRPVVRMTSASHRFDATFQNPILPAGGNYGELFAVFRAVSVPNVDGLMCGIYGPSPGFQQIGLSTQLNKIAVTYRDGGNVATTPFTDVVSVHFVTARLDYESGLDAYRLTIHLDGVDVFTSGNTVTGVPINGTRILVGGSITAFDGFSGLYGLVQTPMSTAERAEIYRIARAEFGF